MRKKPTKKQKMEEIAEIYEKLEREGDLEQEESKFNIHTPIEEQMVREMH